MSLTKVVTPEKFLDSLRTKILAEYSTLAVESLGRLKKAGVRPKLNVDGRTLLEMARKSSIMNGYDFFNIAVDAGDVMFFGDEATDTNTGTTVSIKKQIDNLIDSLGKIVDDWVVSTADKVANAVYRELNKLGAIGKEGRSEVIYTTSKHMSPKNLNTVIKLATARRLNEDAVLEALDTATEGAYVQFYLADGSILYLYPFAKEVTIGKSTNRYKLPYDEKEIRKKLKEVTGLSEGIFLNPWAQNLLEVRA